MKTGEIIEFFERRGLNPHILGNVVIVNVGEEEARNLATKVLSLGNTVSYTEGELIVYGGHSVIKGE